MNPKGLGSAELLRRIAPFGGTLSDARRIQARVIRYGDLNLRRIPQLRGTVRRAAESEFALGALRLVSRVASQEDPFVKFAFATHDGAIIEAVRIPLEKPGRFSLCLSSQAGCPLACTFCATGRMGLKRNLETWEIVDQFLQVRDDLGGAGRISGAVFMGMGEPFLNYDNVLGAAHILCEPSGGGVGAKAITICTAGVTPRIVQFTREGHKFRLGISIVTARRDQRRALMPVEDRWPIEGVLDAVRDHHARTGRLAMAAYVLFGGYNTTDEDARLLGELLRGLPVRLSLVEYNPIDARFRRPTREEFSRFRTAVGRLGIPVVWRYTGGKDVGAACGLLETRRGEGACAEPA